MNQYQDPGAPMRKGMSGGAKIAIGCGVVTVLAVVILCAGVIGVGWFAAQKIAAEIEKYEARGYTVVGDEIVSVDQTVTGPTLYTGNSVTLSAGADDSIAILCERATVTGTFNGDLDFLGQSLNITAGSVVTGDMYVPLAQTIKIGDGAIIQGDIECKLVESIIIGDGAQVWGNITGTISNIQRPEGWSEGQPSGSDTGGDDESGDEGGGG